MTAAQSIVKVGMPKWGLSMTQGKVVDWLVDEGEEVEEGTELADVETEKINGAVEAPGDGVLRRRVSAAGDMVPVGGLLGVIAPADVSDDDIDAFVSEFQATFVPPEEDDDSEPPTRTVEVDGLELRYLQQGDGDGTPIVFVHGFGGDLNNWLFNCEALAEGRRAYALDLPGHGESTKATSGFEGLVRAFSGWLDALGIDHAHLVGHSMGGAVALRTAVDSPELAASLTLVDSAGLGDEINDDYVRGFIEAGRRRDLSRVLGLLFADAGLVTRSMAEDVLRYKRKDGVDDALRALAAEMFPDGRQAVALRDRLADVRAPVLVVWGAQDRILPPAQCRDLPGTAQVHVLDDVGHSPHMEAPGDVNRIIGRFLDDTVTV